MRDGVLTDPRHNERNEGDGRAAIKMMALCIFAVAAATAA